ncbi:hypothetical protein ACGFYU_03845 [Streptomyces sp. NPDC048337]|uniref:hypothetical protein n=1 Tax=Streptomyces sp. NPDC048337 TaxID=3365535 RepID=UPI003717DD08
MSSPHASPRLARPPSLVRHLLPVVLAVQALLLAAPAAVPAAHALTLAPRSAPAVACVRAADCGGSVVVGPLSEDPPSEGPCTSHEPVVCQIRAETPEERVEAQEVRMRYHALLGDMDRTACEMRAQGASEEEIARTLVQMRNDAKDVTRAGMSPEQVRLLEERNMKKYGNPLGPTADQLYAKYGSWSAVSAAATRTNAEVDRELGLEYRPCPCEVEPPYAA